MIELLTSALIEDLLVFLQQHRDYFGLDQKKRLELATAALGKSAFASFLSTVSEKQFVDDLTSALKFLKQQAQPTSGLLKALAQYLLNDFPENFDQLDRQFFAKSEAERKTTLTKLFPEKSRLSTTIRDYLFVYSPQEIGEAIVFFLREVLQSPRIIIQSPLECDTETKSSIRKNFREKYPQSFIVFSVNTQLIGGIRFFVDGKVDDLSWFSKVQQLHALAAHR